MESKFKSIILLLMLNYSNNVFSINFSSYLPQINCKEISKSFHTLKENIKFVAAANALIYGPIITVAGFYRYFSIHDKIETDLIKAKSDLIKQNFNQNEKIEQEKRLNELAYSNQCLNAVDSMMLVNFGFTITCLGLIHLKKQNGS